jgi:hypothetical protein
MDKNKQRIKIAEVCGYTHVRIIKAIEGPPDIGIGHHPTEPHSVPDYLNDLNAMHELVNILSYEQAELFEDELCDLVMRSIETIENPPPFKFAVANATAAQRAKAFLKTLNLWEE